jgi:hypothetical protein
VTQQQLPDSTPYDPAVVALGTEIRRLSEDYNIEADRVAGCFRRLVITLAPELLSEPAEFEAALGRFPLCLLAHSLDSLLPGEALSLIETEDLERLANRVGLTEYLCRDTTPFYTLEELADRVQQFAEHLQRDRDYLIKTGLPSRCFRACRWLYRNLARLYDVRTTASPRPGDEVFGGTDDPRGGAGEPYRWVKLNEPSGGLHEPHSEPGEPDIWANLPPGPYHSLQNFQYCAYEQADLLNGMRVEAAARIEAERPRFLDLKIRVLEEVAAALLERDAAGIWPRCLRVLTSTLSAEDALFYLDLDRWYMGVDVRRGGAADASPRMIPGGLSNILEVIGHCEQELSVGAFSRTRQALGGMVVVDRPGRLSAGASHRGHPYFQFIGRPERVLLDAALDRLLSLGARVDQFWEGYRGRVNGTLLGTIRAEAGVTMQQRFIPVLRPLVQLYADRCEESLVDGVPIPPPVPDPSALLEALDGSVQGGPGKANESGGTTAEGLTPCWDKERGELRMGRRVVRRVRHLAKNVVCILDTFQDDGWPPRIDDPLPGESGQQSDSQRMSETIRQLNRGLRVIKFVSDGTGAGIRWQWR